MHQYLSKQAAGNLYRGPRIEGPAEDFSPSTAAHRLLRPSIATKADFTDNGYRKEISTLAVGGIMRLFTGIDLPAEVRDNLAALLDRLRPTARMRWSPAENLHVTTKFIGEWPQDRLRELIAVLRELPGPRRRSTSPSGGWAGSRIHAPRVFWAGVRASTQPWPNWPARRTKRVARLGVPSRDAPLLAASYPGAYQGTVPLDRLRQAITALPSDEFGEFAADRFHLYLSELGPAGSVYTKLEEFVFARS